jgi:hypothetical protein
MPGLGSQSDDEQKDHLPPSEISTDNRAHKRYVNLSSRTKTHPGFSVSGRK